MLQEVIIPRHYFIHLSKQLGRHKNTPWGRSPAVMQWSINLNICMHKQINNQKLKSIRSCYMGPYKLPSATLNHLLNHSVVPDLTVPDGSCCLCLHTESGGMKTCSIAYI